MLEGRRIKNKALRQYYEQGNGKGIKPEWLGKVRRILQALDAITDPAELYGLVGFHLHKLKGNRLDDWAVTIRGNWRITFKWRDEGPYDVDMEDYHGK